MRRKCNVPCPIDVSATCDPSDDKSYNPETECCEDGKPVKKVAVHYINRNGNHADIMIPIPGTATYHLAGFFGWGSGSGSTGSASRSAWQNSTSSIFNLSSDPTGFCGFGLNGYWNISYQDWMSEGDGDRRATAQGVLGRGQPSDICTFYVCPKEAEDMFVRLFIEDAGGSPSFDIAGSNCSTGAARVLGIEEIEGLDTPNHLQEQILAMPGANCRKGWTLVLPDDSAMLELPVRGDY